jgi:acyl-CoA synthetase (AMP-forming)/AMP-acid ligase II
MLRADVLAHRLRQLGAGPDVLAALYLDRGIGLIAGILGILKAGGAYLPIDANTPSTRINWLLRDSVRFLGLGNMGRASFRWPTRDRGRRNLPVPDAFP